MVMSIRMNEFHHQRGAVYILENTEACRVKIGMTTNDVASRLRHVNDIWLEQKVTCQICGGKKFFNDKGLVSKHIISGNSCMGGNALPLEKDKALAELHLENLKNSLSNALGNKKQSIARLVSALEKRIELYSHYKKPIGTWKISTVFHTARPEQVEQLSHEILADRLDTKATFGEVFCCSQQEASEAVESALCQLGFIGSVKKEDQLQSTRGIYLKYLEYPEQEIKREKYECAICGSQWEVVMPGLSPCPKCKTHLYGRPVASSPHGA